MGMRFDLKDRTILLIVGGSRAYGMDMPTSDVDVKGVAIPTGEYFHGSIHRFEQAEGSEHIAPFIPLMNEDEQAAIAREKIEGTVFEIRKFVSLALDCNPNIWDALWARDEEVRLITPLGEKLRENRDLFLSAKARWSFAGYSRSQLNRIRGHRAYLLHPPGHEPTRAEFELPDRTVIPADQLMAAQAAIQKKVDGWEIDYGAVDPTTKVALQSRTAEVLADMSLHADERWTSAARSIGYDENFLLLLDRERRYKGARLQWEQYHRWKRERNPERAAMEEKYGMDCKHAAHLIRLSRMCLEVLTTGKVNVWREDRDDLLNIRHGGWTYERVVEEADRIDAECDTIYKAKTYVIPHQPDREAVDALCVEMVEEALSKGDI